MEESKKKGRQEITKDRTKKKVITSNRMSQYAKG